MKLLVDQPLKVEEAEHVRREALKHLMEMAEVSRQQAELRAEMMERALKPREARAARRSKEGSLLIIVLRIAFGLVALTLYFAHAMSLELRASDNRVAAVESAQAIEGAARYLSPGPWPPLPGSGEGVVAGIRCLASEGQRHEPTAPPSPFGDCR